MPLDLSKLQNPRAGPNGTTSYACPCCRLDLGRDKSGNHLIVYSDGRYGCAAFPDDHAHRSRIWALAGDGSTANVTPQQEQREPQIEVPRIYPDSVLDRLIKDYTFWNGRGISDETIAPFRGGVATQFQMADRWVFPQFNERDEIIGFSGRCLRQMSEADRKRFRRPKWKHLTPSSSFIWGGLDEIAACGRAILVESIGDSLALREHGVPESLVLFGTVPSQAVLGKLISLNPREIIVSTNRDIKDHHVGQKAAAKIETMLLRFFDRESVRVSLPTFEEIKDWGECSNENIEEWRNSLDNPLNPDSLE